MNPIRQQVNKFCQDNGICTSCYGRMALPTHSQCEQCLERKRAHKARYHAEVTKYDKAYYKKHREARKAYQRAYRQRREKN